MRSKQQYREHNARWQTNGRNHRSLICGSVSIYAAMHKLYMGVRNRSPRITAALCTIHWHWCGGASLSTFNTRIITALISKRYVNYMPSTVYIHSDTAVTTRTSRRSRRTLTSLTRSERLTDGRGKKHQRHQPMPTDSISTHFHFYITTPQPTSRRVSVRMLASVGVLFL